MRCHDCPYDPDIDLVSVHTCHTIHLLERTLELTERIHRMTADLTAAVAAEDAVVNAAIGDITALQAQVQALETAQGDPAALAAAIGDIKATTAKLAGALPAPVETPAEPAPAPEASAEPVAEPPAEPAPAEPPTDGTAPPA